MKKTILCIFLTLLMVLTALPMTVSAAGTLTVTGISNYCPDLKAKTCQVGEMVTLSFSMPEKCDIISMRWSAMFAESKLRLSGLSTFAPWAMKVDIDEYPYITGSLELDPRYPYGAKQGEEIITFVFDTLEGDTAQVELTIESLTVKGSDGSPVEIIRDGVDLRSVVSFSVKSFLDESEGVKALMVKRNDSTTFFNQTVHGNSAMFVFTNVPSGLYTLTLTKKNHVSRSVNIPVGNPVDGMEYTLHPIGDANLDGQISPLDVAVMNNHIKGKKSLEGYAFSCADVTGTDKNITPLDISQINLHLKNKKSLWL